mmetsp:Transcript_29337/g.41249  ORF Transcript_29337/g.41249 Transcript_29337/m.41249 type:complete len:175 (+) Transcript_29337:1-525(+)
MRVMEVRGSYLLVETMALPANPNNSGGGNCPQHHRMRLHRNAVFVIERTNLVDGVVNAALLPADVFLSTGVGQQTARAATPILSTVGDVAMPLLLASKLTLGVLKTTGGATLSGVSAGVSAVVQQSQQDLQRRQQEASFHADQHGGGRTSKRGGNSKQNSGMSPPQYVQQYHFV